MGHSGSHWKVRQFHDIVGSVVDRGPPITAGRSMDIILPSLKLKVYGWSLTIPALRLSVNRTSQNTMATVEVELAMYYSTKPSI